ncbi:MAG: hypothetical protein JNG88_08370 [Phycisphaerales bacterium]|nr:hypothetical protein [Phycisphaerales bacterium]
METKTAPQARIAIRQALGQLLEYVHDQQSSRRRHPELFVVAPAPALDIQKYLKVLERKYGLRLKYREFNLGEDTFRV